MTQIVISQKGEKARRLKAENEKPSPLNLPIGYGKPAKKISVQEMEKHYRENIFRAGNDWKPGRVTPAYRANYDEIFRKKDAIA